VPRERVCALLDEREERLRPSYVSGEERHLAFLP